MSAPSNPLGTQGLSEDVRFCKKCVISNQRPSSTAEFRNRNKKTTIFFDEQGVCSACRYHEDKYDGIDWEQRENELQELLEKHRSKDGSYDVVVPGSGGKDSVYVSHALKHRYGMHPLTVTWPPNMYTDIGRRNFEAWLDSGFDNISVHPNRKVHRHLTRLAFLNLCHPFQPFIIGQKQVGPKMAIKHGIKLIIYGENPAETGSNLAEAYNPIMKPSYYSLPRADQRKTMLGGCSYDQLLEMGFTHTDLMKYLPVALEDIEESGTEVRFLAYYKRWRPQEMFYYASEHCGFTLNPERSEGTYSKYSSLDDKIDGFHYFTTFAKFGIGRATYDAAQEIRNRHLTREEGVALVKRYDGEFPKKYFPEFLDYCDIDEETFWAVTDRARPPHLWRTDGNEWKLRHQVEN